MLTPKRNAAPKGAAQRPHIIGAGSQSGQGQNLLRTVLRTLDTFNQNQDEENDFGHPAPPCLNRRPGGPGQTQHQSLRPSRAILALPPPLVQTFLPLFLAFASPLPALRRVRSADARLDSSRAELARHIVLAHTRGAAARNGRALRRRRGSVRQSVSPRGIR